MKKSNLCFMLTLALTGYSVGSNAEVTIDDLSSDTPNLPVSHKEQPKRDSNYIFSSTVEMMDEFNDYPSDIGAFKIKAEKPLSVQISPRVMDSELQQPEYIVDDVERAAIYAAYRILFQTNIDKVTVTSVPLLIDAETKNKSYVEQYAVTFKITKKAAIKIANRYCRVSSKDELFKKDGYTFSDDFKNNCYQSSSKNHKSFFADLTHSEHLSY
ncbi:hypothetical protein [Enterobacter hormaechei]|uniref:hypothetical protein n=1 Tax=Enterobacter cloacae complex TaxID=354276 RepID=UPI0012550CC2|nr:hypothetical protein [Enterobacter hormaechei]HED1599553.1 hypothetical protein [Enterobacter hormaechei subsp. hoffmannii]MBA7810264.1 hypothetical protein [Enterobacter hormaechei]MBA7908766.1 hypothetical protein [Enterobacter hormaechei]MBE0232403.1 hypothetical protein [Enterobacter hormaechei]MBK4286020.1 hypothetical protein [Enterobacter hormaechei]